MAARILLVDNYDSFTYNLYQYLGELGADTRVVRNDELSAEQALELKPDAVVISPGPGTPDQAGVSLELIRRAAFRRTRARRLPRPPGARTGIRGPRRARAEADARQDVARSTTTAAASSPALPNPFTATRYHSLVVARETVPDCLEVSAWTDDGLVMGLRHREHARSRGSSSTPRAS